MPRWAGMTREQRVSLRATAAVSDVTETGAAVVLRMPEAADTPMLNRVVGLGLERLATRSDVDKTLAAVGTGISFYVALAPAAGPRELPGWLRERGLEAGWGWMSFRRGVDDPPAAHTSLRIAEVAGGGDGAAAFARVVRESYCLPERLEARLAVTPKSGWLCWVAFDGDEAAAAAALYVAERTGYLGFAGTLASHRGKGAQSALLSERIRRARQLGCDLLVTETGERRDDRPSNSYRNILRAGFSEVAVTANWLGRR